MTRYILAHGVLQCRLAGSTGWPLACPAFALCIASPPPSCWASVSAVGQLGAPWIHEVGLSLAMIVGAFALGRGIMEHGFMMPSAVGSIGLGVMAGALSLPHDGTEALYTVIGVGILALWDISLNSIAAE